MTPGTVSSAGSTSSRSGSAGRKTSRSSRRPCSILACSSLSRNAVDAESLFTRKGYSWSTDVRGGSESFGSSTSFLRLRVTGNLVVPLDRAHPLLVPLGVRRDRCRRFVAPAAVAAFLRGRRSQRPRLSLSKTGSDGHDGRRRRRPLPRHGQRRGRLSFLPQLRRRGVL